MGISIKQYIYSPLGSRTCRFPSSSVWLINNQAKQIKALLIFRTMGLKEEFEEYAEKAKQLPENTSNDDKLILYGLFKQATVGNVNTSRPGMFNMRDRAKWDAWKAIDGKTQEEAMNDYITKVKQLQEAASS
nr:acyl-CoA-binding protein [Ipomoea batatas]